MSDKQKQLIEYVTQDLITMLIERQNLSIEEAMHRVYHSEFYAKLLNPESGLYLEGSEYLYGVMMEMGFRPGSVERTYEGRMMCR